MLRTLSSLPVLVAVVAFTLLVGGAPAMAIQDTAGEKILRIHWPASPSTVDPQRIAAIEDIGIAGLAWEGLTRIDEQMTTVPAAAESWEFSPDGLTLTFHLRDGLVYSDGSPLTAERFRYAIERTCIPSLKARIDVMVQKHIGIAVDKPRGIFKDVREVTGGYLPFEMALVSVKWSATPGYPRTSDPSTGPISSRGPLSTITALG